MFIHQKDNSVDFILDLGKSRYWKISQEAQLKGTKEEMMMTEVKTVAEGIEKRL